MPRPSSAVDTRARLLVALPLVIAVAFAASLAACGAESSSNNEAERQAGTVIAQARHKAGNSTLPITADAIPHVSPEGFERAVDDWETHLADRGTQLGEKFRSKSTADINASAPYAWYYDAQRIFFQAGDYFGHSGADWDAYAQAAETAYRDYVGPDYNMPGYERHPHGLAMDVMRNNDNASRTSLRGIRSNGPFSDVLTNSTSGTWFEQRYSREVAYMIDTHVMATHVDLPRADAALAEYVDMALNHVEIWTSGNYRADDPAWQFCQSFMTGLTASALIAYYDLTVNDGSPDDRVPPALRRLGDWLITHMLEIDHNVEGTYSYIPEHYASFKYIVPAISGIGSEDPTPDLNLLIVPLFAWLYRETGEQLYRDIGDLAFIGGVAFAYLVPDKNFNQNYRASFDYLTWRTEGNTKWDN